MKQILFVAFLAASISAAPKGIFYGNYKFDESAAVGVNLLPSTRSQHHPTPCHASWAFAITTAMSALFNKAQKGAFPEVVLSPQMLIHTRPEDVDFKCATGMPSLHIEKILNQLKVKGVSDEGCNNYYADDSRKTDRLAECMDCHNAEDRDQPLICEFVPYRAHKLKNWVHIVSSQEDPKAKDKELREKVLQAFESNGPLICQLGHSDLLFRTRHKVKQFYLDPQPTMASWQVLVGYEMFEGKESVTVQTALGDNVGYYGTVTLDLSGSDNPHNIFGNCYSLEIDPVTPIIKYDQSEQSPRGFLKSLLSVDKGVKNTNYGGPRASLHQGYIPSSFQGIFNEGLEVTRNPTPINWGNRDGRNYLTYTKQQHIPVYCGSCWAQASISVISDRLNIQRIRSGIVYPRINLSVQAIINCKQGGSCAGGDQSIIFQRALKWKIPIESCHPYESKNPSDFKCDIRKKCSLPLPDKSVNDYADFAGAKVTKWIRVQGADAMKTALESGPITCSFKVTKEFVGYKRIEGEDKNIWTKNGDFLDLNHAISVVGWDIQKNVPYWIVRNSWGKEWGYDGFFYIEAGKNLLGIESDCAAAEVVFEEFK